MKKTFLLLLLSLHCLVAVNAQQVTFKIASGTNIVTSGAARLVMDTGQFVNNGTFMDSTGIFIANGGIDFSGTGTTRFNKFNIDNSQHSVLNSLVSVYNTANIISGNLDANNNLYIRSDANSIAGIIVSGILTNNVKGLITRASATSGPCPSYTSGLSVNISGPVANYQWQSSSDSTTWSNISSATDATYTSTVTATSFYRCLLTTSNSTFNEASAGIRLTLAGLPDPGTITGASTVNSGSNITLSDGIIGGSWSLSNTNATISGNVVTGAVTGIDTVSYTVTNSCGVSVAKKILTIGSSSIPGITGFSSVCIGGIITLADMATGGTWSSSNAGVAAITATTGIVTGIATGTAIITYTLPIGFTIKTITVNSSAPITGVTNSCVSQTTILSDDIPGGIWSSSNTFVATVGGSNGVVTGAAAGSVTILYTLPSGCVRTAAVTMNPLSVTGGPSVVCQGSTITQTNITTGGGTWSSSNNAIATAGATTGVIGGIGFGTAVISFKTPTGCIMTSTITVNATAAISGTIHVCPGLTTTLSNSVPGGVWSSSNTYMATVSAGSGIVTGVAAGSPIITYASPAGCTKSAPVTVYQLNGTSAVPASLCTSHAIIYLTNNTPGGGTWSSSNTAIATITLTTGGVKGVAAGAANILFTSSVGGCVKSLPLTVALCKEDDLSAITSEIATQNELQIFPNPNSGAFTIKGFLGVTENNEVTVEATNMLGQVVYRNNFPAQNGVVNTQIQFDNSLANGTYILSIRSGILYKMWHVVVKK